VWDRINTDKSRDRELVLDEVEAVIEGEGYKIAETNRDKPWGAYFRLDKKDTEHFLEHFFLNVKLPSWAENLPLDPKILVMEPNKRLSWQYHLRRGEVWQVIAGPVGAYVSNTDDLPELPRIINANGNVQIPPKGRHRLAGLDSWGIVAEIWVHSDRNNPSDEEDIIRLQDDYGRQT